MGVLHPKVLTLTFNKQKIVKPSQTGCLRNRLFNLGGLRYLICCVSVLGGRKEPPDCNPNQREIIGKRG